MTPEQEMEYQEMKLNYDRFKSDSKQLEFLNKELVKLIPKEYMIKHLQKSKIIKRKWELNNNGK